MRQERGGEDEHLAPVIPLFGEGVAAVPTWRSTWDEDPPTVTARTADRARGRQERPTRADRVESSRHGSATEAPHDAGAPDASERAAAETVVLRRLRARPLSEAEVRAVIASSALDEASAEDLVRGLLRHGYVDDHALAHQLVRTATERKGQGRQVVAQTLVKRQIPRDVAEAALAALPDDDAERAFAFAQTKARAMSRLDRETALRRLAGQLARRGYSSSVALAAARRALDDVEN